jgi:hypothetical protein
MASSETMLQHTDVAEPFLLTTPRIRLSGLSLALIGNASGQGAEGARSCSEAFSIRRLEGRRWQWWALLWS